MVYNLYTSPNFGSRARQYPTVSDVTDEFDFTLSFPYSIFSALRCICQQRGHWAPAYVMWRPPPSPPVSLSTSHSVQGTLAAKINVGCECLMACRCLLRCRCCRCPCIFLFRLQDIPKCRSSCSTCTAKLRLYRSTRVLSRDNTRVPVYFVGVFRLLSRLFYHGLCPAANSISILMFLFPGDHNLSFVTELKQAMYHWMYLLHAINSDCQHDCRRSSDRLQHSGRWNKSMFLFPVVFLFYLSKFFPLLFTLCFQFSVDTTGFKDIAPFYCRY